MILVKQRSVGYTMIEILVVISIIGVLSVLAYVSLNVLKSKIRDVKRLNDVKQVQKALDIYANDHEGQYPPTSKFIEGEPLLSSDDKTTYLVKIPKNDKATGNCAESPYDYRLGTDGKTYDLGYCLGIALQGYEKGDCTAMPGQLCNQANCSCHDSAKPCCGWCLVGEQCGGGVLYAKNFSPGVDLVIMPPISGTQDLPSASNWSATTGVDEPAHDSSDGLANTNNLLGNPVDNNSASDALTPNNLLALYCFNLVKNGYSDWYLPSLNEALSFYSYKNSDANSGLLSDIYWTSTQVDSAGFNYAYMADLSNGTSFTKNKTLVNSYLRCVRRAP